jgi:hypothetical protein
MFRTALLSALLSAVTLIGATLSSASHAETQAIVYCNGPGVPVGCVARPAARAPVIYCTSPGVPLGCVARPAARARVIYCTRPGYPVGCVNRGAPGVGVAPGVPGNRGGPVNRVGRF